MIKGIKATKELMEKYPFVYEFAVGVHPDEVGDLDEEVMTQIQALSRPYNCGGDKEIGLDYYWDKENRRARYTGSSVKWMWPVRRRRNYRFHTATGCCSRYFR